ncbi:hypothetical protein ASC77_02990 [Nocardioides sp. Root1257]|uniref:alpha-(1->3)-arabinofuranosyltransferase domain-containing protein n=1 Tax=unclassified Nocardioides TaxID=2615069 RepID=UPI0006F3B565|nr:MULTISPECIES: alpha-(1->3)-arabinofuranosyltransferase family protein [unclassified Nocardioides]KQW53272.1 hypothetical protein ASC77_02990 [Nocardioides sp. Root1257]KRC55958.1 hypothetical protein ASE24_02990 [Nocardioides sp. Root224]
MAGYLAILTAFAFSQSAGRTVADTKFDLVTNPLKFLGNGLRLWDPSAAFGQIQNQAYGYAWPMGPFFLIGHALELPPWVIQRLWWSLLLCLAFVGIVRLAQRLGVGSPLTQVLAAFAFVLTPRISTLLGGTSVEVWPMALAPWVLIPLVVGTQRGSVRRAAAASALVVACCGGVNAIAVAAVLPLGVIWILTRTGGPRKWRLLGWWTLFTALATLWWWGPLLFLARYSVPFLDYIENATITTVPTDLVRTVVGTSDWVGYFAGIDFPAGQQLVTTPFLLLQAAAVAAFGLVGVALRSNPHQRFLAWGVLVGVVLVGFGYAGDLSGFLAADRREWLDGTLAPLRNLHKFDVVLRVPLVLGLAHVLTVLPALARDRVSTAGSWMLRVAAVLAIASLVLPWAQDRTAPRQGVTEVPDYWYAAADYLHEHDDGTVALVVPASAFGVYAWGNVHDDILQGLASSPWAVRNVIPLAQPGNVVFLDAITRVLESGHPSDSLAPFLAENGVGSLVVRNDLDRLDARAPDPAYIKSVLAGSSGIRLAASFGPEVGQKAYDYAPGSDVRVVNGNGIAAVQHAVEIYTVDDAAAATVTKDPGVLLGDPGTGVDVGMQQIGPGPRVLAEDAPGDLGGQVLTDGNQRRETNFAAVRSNVSSTMEPDSPYRLNGPEHTHRFLRDPERWQTTVGWTGAVSSVTSSTSQADANAQPPIEIGADPAAALDGDPATEWRSARHLDPTGQWWAATFAAVRVVPSVTVQIGRSSAPVGELRISSGDQERTVPAPAPGKARTYALDFTRVRTLRITAAGDDLALPGSFALGEVRGLGTSQRYLDLPVPDPRFPLDAIVATRDVDRATCVESAGAVNCDPSLYSPGEDGDTLARRWYQPYASTYQLTGTVSLRRTVDASVLLTSGVEVTSDQAINDVASSPVALADGDPSTTWIAQSTDEVLDLQLPRPTRLDTLHLDVNPAAPAALPTALLVSTGTKQRVVRVDDEGDVDLPRWRTDQIEIKVVDVERGYTAVGGQFLQMPAGISELELNGEPLNRNAGVSRDLPCGIGPQVFVGGQTRDTSFRASSKTLIHGGSVPLQVCGSPDVSLPIQSTSLRALPTPVFRADSVTLVHGQLADVGVLGEEDAPVSAVPVERDDRGAPEAVELPSRAGQTLLTLPQNINDGWTASLDGTELTSVRVDGWKQGWMVPAGAAATVQFHFSPGTPFVVLLGIGLLAALSVVLVWAWPRRGDHARSDPPRTELPPLTTGRAGIVDVVVVVAAGGLLAGWLGLAGAAAAVVLGRFVRRFAAWPWLAGLTLVMAGLALGWDRLTQQSWVVTWSQAWTLAAVCMLVAAVARSTRSTDGDVSPLE